MASDLAVTESRLWLNKHNANAFLSKQKHRAVNSAATKINTCNRGVTRVSKKNKMKTIAFCLREMDAQC